MEGTEDSPAAEAETTNAVDGSLTNGHITGQSDANGSGQDNHGNQQQRPSATTPFPQLPSTVAPQVNTPKEASNSPASLRGGGGSGLLARRQASNATSSEVRSMNGNIDMPDQPDEDEMHAHLENQRTRTQTPDIEQAAASVEGPLTPRNNAGPFVFDGSADRSDAMQLQVPGIPEVTGGNERS